MSTITLRGYTSWGWTSANPILPAGEYVVEIDSAKTKTGDGATAWNDLSYNDALFGLLLPGFDSGVHMCRLGKGFIAFSYPSLPSNEDLLKTAAEAEALTKLRYEQGDLPPDHPWLSESFDPETGLILP